MQGIFYNEFENSYIPHILKEIYIERVYDRFFKGRKDLVVLDIGANIGLFSHFAYKYAKKIIAVEPAQQDIDIFKHTIKFNKMDDKIKPIRAALFSRDEEMILNHNTNETMFSLHNAIADPTKGTEKVPGITLETLFKEENIDHVDFMKLDIEGAEVDVVGSRGFEAAASKIDAMVVEYHDWSGRNPSQLGTALEDYGFEVFVIPADAKLFGAIRKK